MWSCLRSDFTENSLNLCITELPIVFVAMAKALNKPESQGVRKLRKFIKNVRDQDITLNTSKSGNLGSKSNIAAWPVFIELEEE